MMQPRDAHEFTCALVGMGEIVLEGEFDSLRGYGEDEGGVHWERAGLPNGSRLSCGAKAGGRKRPALRYELVGAQTDASSESRPRQLQALVMPHRTNQRLEGLHGNAATRYTTALSSMYSR